MEQEVRLFTKPEDLIQWIQERELPFDISMEDSEMLLGYLEGHDYAIGQDEAGVLYRKDVAEVNGEIEVYSMDEVIDIVCQWNYVIFSVNFINYCLNELIIEEGYNEHRATTH